MKIISLDKGCFAFILGLLLWCSHMHANYISHNKTISYWQSAVSGTVSDAAGTLPGVTVFVKGTSVSTITDEKGQYSINAALGDTLVFSFIGYKEVEYVVSGTTLDVVLAEDAAQLQEVVINAGYYSIKDRERTGSIARITSKDIENQPVTNILATMQGRMAGVSVTQNSGVPGGGFDIQIRGINSLRADGNSPLYIINGVPYAADGIGSGVTGIVIPGQKSPLNSINPSDIENIEILKDADATAIYGSRGANGVVLITTKKGKAGKTAFSAGATTGVGKVTGRMKLMDTAQYLEMRRQALENDGITAGPSDYDVNGTWNQDRYTDWQEVFIGGNAIYSDLNASVTGGSDKTQFLLSGSYHKETTVFPGDYSYRRGNILSNLSHSSSDSRFRINLTGTYAVQDNTLPGQDLTSLASRLAPNAPALYDSQGNLNWEGSTWENPMALLESVYKANTKDLTANSTLSYEVLPGFVLKSSLGYTDTRFDDSTTNPSTMYDPAYGAGSEFSTIYVNTLSRNSWIIEPQVNWYWGFSKVKVDMLAGTTFQERNSSQRVFDAAGFTSNSMIYNLSNASYLRVMQDMETQYRYNAVFARLNFNWDGRYILNLTGRRDGSSRFGPGRQFANFGAIGGAWLFHREAFLKDAGFLSLGKLRGSYGISGNDLVGDYQFLNTYGISGNNYSGISGMQPARLYNPNFGWESNRKLELALELGLLKDRITMTAAYFRNRSSNQLVGIPLPGTTGFTSIQANLDAEVENKGFEFTLRSAIVQGKDFSWTTGFNISLLKNRLLSFPGLESSTYRNQYVLGEALNIAKLYHLEGVDPQTGIYRFTDYNGDGAITASEDQQHIEDLNPEFFGGLQNTLSYKGWQLDFLFQFVKQQGFNEIYGLGVPGTRANQSPELLDRWQQLGDIASNQLFTTGVNAEAQDAQYKFLASDGAPTDMSFIRLKNISFSYTLPRGWIKGLDCRISGEGQNIFVITPYKGADPESRLANRLPPLRVISVGIHLNF